MIVAAIALIVALAGTAMAAPTAIKSILNKKEKKQVKSISKNQVNALAPGLSVKHSGTADKANTAANADALGGVELKNVVVAKSDNPGGQCDPNSSTLIDCATVDLTLPHEGRVLLVGTGGQIAFNAAEAATDCLFRIDGANSGGAVRIGNQSAPAVTGVGARDFSNGFTTTVVTAPIAAGAHQFKLVCNEVHADVEIEAPQLTAALVGSG
jgi:hypothetical protein